MDTSRQLNGGPEAENPFVCQVYYVTHHGLVHYVTRHGLVHYVTRHGLVHYTTRHSLVTSKKGKQ